MTGERATTEEDRVLGLPERAADHTEPYGPHPDQVIDFWFPRGTPDDEPDPGAGMPLVTLVHGGFWRERYDRRHLSPLAAHLAGRGFPVASVEYRRVGGAGGWPATFQDVASAVALAPAVVARHLPAPAPQVLVGHSAGGHLALWAAARAAADVTAVVALAPVADLGHALALGLGAGAVADLLDGDPGRLADTDPVALLPTGVPTTLVHGRDDDTVPLLLSERFVAAARAAGDEPRLVALDATGHFPLIAPGSPACGVLEDELRRWSGTPTSGTPHA
ncbi:hypothetical protein AQ490_04285 [Wenjunlia vitaminophila]|uniref:BD-FAE-like domain-containing protein n=1 Tax=Wenjunlia vitaminophila TaxID=76728 RepID=A0A0T6LQR8_WENVI|nr:alpha/beta fold hydrolase [Wenjunlia vitaminophila]KRV48474.1 hypothetical protein AQ490_04285 [Wenjunlia vitaminophila]